VTLSLQGYPRAMDTTGSAKRLTARSERGEERVQAPSSHPSLFQSLDFSPSHTVHLFSSLPPHNSVFILLQTKAQIFQSVPLYASFSLSLYFYPPPCFFLYPNRSWP